VVLPVYPFQRERYWVTTDNRPPTVVSRAKRSAVGGAVHPLLGHKLRTSLKSTLIFETELSATEPGFLKDHRVYGQVIFPGTGYLEMALAAAAQLGSGLSRSPFQLESVSIHSPLFLSEKEASTLQLTLLNVENGQTSFQIHSLEAEDRWKLHTTGNLKIGPPADSVQKISAEPNGQAWPPAEYYQTLRNVGIEYGPSFQGIQQLWRQDGAAWGEIQLPAEAGDSQGYFFHPALLDACFQTLGAALPNLEHPPEQDDAYLPVGIGRLWMHHPVGDRVQVRASVRPSSNGAKETLIGDIAIFDESGQLMAELNELNLKRASRETLRGVRPVRVEDWLYEVAWQTKPLELRLKPDPPKTEGGWLIFADSSGLAEAMAARLRAQGATCDLVFPGDQYAELTSGRWQINPAQPEDFKRLLQGWKLGAGVVYLCPAESGSPETIMQPLLYLVQALADAKVPEPPRLWLVTRGAQPVADKQTSLALAQAPVWGLGKVITQEHPELQCVCIDLDPNGEAEEASALVTELFSRVE
jgi:acyl transferase domain-containing protein